jgi:hypothetical protein
VPRCCTVSTSSPRRRSREKSIAPSGPPRRPPLGDWGGSVVGVWSELARMQAGEQGAGCVLGRRGEHERMRRGGGSSSPPAAGGRAAKRCDDDLAVAFAVSDLKRKGSAGIGGRLCGPVSCQLAHLSLPPIVFRPWSAALPPFSGWPGGCGRRNVR